METMRRPELVEPRADLSDELTALLGMAFTAPPSESTIERRAQAIAAAVRSERLRGRDG